MLVLVLWLCLFGGVGGPGMFGRFARAGIRTCMKQNGSFLKIENRVVQMHGTGHWPVRPRDTALGTCRPGSKDEDAEKKRTPNDDDDA